MLATINKFYQAMTFLKPGVNQEYLIPHPQIQENIVLRDPPTQELAINDILSMPYKDLEKATNFWNENNLLERGSFSEVFEGKWINIRMAIKRFKKKDKLNGTKNEIVERFVRELRCWNRLNHDNILSLYGYCKDDQQLCSISEFMVNGSLYDCLHCYKNIKALSWSTRVKIATGVAKGLKFLHEMTPPLIHGNIKSKNILLDENFVAKICGFGLAQDGSENQLSKSQSNLAYLPDEFCTDMKITIKTDIYSFGVVLFELATGMMAQHNQEMKLTDYICDYEEWYDHDEWYLTRLMDYSAGSDGDYCYLPLINLAKKCTNKDSQCRLSIVEVYKELITIERRLEDVLSQ